MSCRNNLPKPVKFQRVQHFEERGNCRVEDKESVNHLFKKTAMGQKIRSPLDRTLVQSRDLILHTFQSECISFRFFHWNICLAYTNSHISAHPRFYKIISPLEMNGFPYSDIMFLRAANSSERSILLIQKFPPTKLHPPWMSPGRVTNPRYPLNISDA